MAGADGPFCQGAVRGQRSGQMAALPLGTEGKEQRNVFQGRLQAGKDLVQGVRLQYGIKPVRSPFSYIHWLPCEGCCPVNQGFVIRFHQRGAYFRHSLPKYCLFYDDIFHDKEHLSCNLFEFVWIHYKAGRGFRPYCNEKRTKSLRFVLSSVKIYEAFKTIREKRKDG